MATAMDWFMLVLLLACVCLTCAWRRYQHSQSYQGAVSTTVQRLLKPRTPDDCPACQSTPPALPDLLQRVFPSVHGLRSKVAVVRPNGSLRTASPAPRQRVPTIGSRMRRSTRSSAMARMGSTSASKPSAVRRVGPPFAPAATRRSTASKPQPTM